MRSGKMLLLVMVGLLHVVVALLSHSSFRASGDCSAFCGGHCCDFYRRRLAGRCSRTLIPCRVRERRSSQSDPRILTSKIAKAKTAAELLALVAANVDTREFNAFHVSVTFSRLAKFNKVKKLGSDNTQRNLVWPRLVSRLRSMIKEGLLDARAVANAAYAVAELHGQMDRSRDMSELYPELAKAIAAKSSDMKPQGLSNCLWAAATLKSQVPGMLKVVPVLARHMLLNTVDRPGPQDLANNLWAASQLHETVPEILTIVPAFAGRVADEVHNMNPQELSNSLGAAARLQEAAPEVLDAVPALITSIPHQVSRMSPQDLSTNLWSIAKLQKAVPEVVSAVSKLSVHVSRAASKLVSQGLSLSLWAAAKLQESAPEVLDVVPALVKCMPSKVDNMTPQQLSQSLWAAAKLQRAVPQVLNAVPVLVDRGTHRLAEDSLEGLRMSCWAAEQLGERELEARLKEELSRRKR